MVMIMKGTFQTTVLKWAEKKRVQGQTAACTPRRHLFTFLTARCGHPLHKKSWSSVVTGRQGAKDGAGKTDKGWWCEYQRSSGWQKPPPSRVFHLRIRCEAWIQKNKSERFSVVSDSLRPHGLWPARLLCPWESPGKNAGIFLTWGSNLGPLGLRQKQA